jgi:hypothetical protein
MKKGEKKNPNRKRTKHVDLKLTENEFQEIDKKAKEAKLSKQEFLHRSAFGKEIVVIENGVEVVRELIRIGTNLNQIAKVANASGVVDTKSIEKLSVEVGMIWRQLNLSHLKKGET